MSPNPYLLRNAARRPVELHAPDGSVRVIAPGDAVRIDAANPTCDRLERAGVLTRHAVPPETAPETVPEAAPEAGDKAAPKDAGKDAGKKRASKPKAAPAAPPEPAATSAPSRSSRSAGPPADEPGGSS